MRAVIVKRPRADACPGRPAPQDQDATDCGVVPPVPNRRITPSNCCRIRSGYAACRPIGRCGPMNWATPMRHGRQGSGKPFPALLVHQGAVAGPCGLFQSRDWEPQFKRRRRLSHGVRARVLAQVDVRVHQSRKQPCVRPEIGDSCVLRWGLSCEVRVPDQAVLDHHHARPSGLDAVDDLPGLELQRDWARTDLVAPEDLAAVMGHSGGAGVAFAWEMQVLNTPVPTHGR